MTFLAISAPWFIFDTTSQSCGKSFHIKALRLIRFDIFRNIKPFTTLSAPPALTTAAERICTGTVTAGDGVVTAAPGPEPRPRPAP